MIHLTVPYDQVDVNVHPAKAEIRFQEPGRVYALLLAALRQGLGPLQGAGPRYTVTWHPASFPQAQETAALLAPELTPPGPTSSLIPEAPAVTRPVASPEALSLFRFQDLTVIGQLQDTYILAQGHEGLVVIDQHAAHERILYESLKSRSAPGPRQPLLFPRVIEVSPAQADWVKENLEALAQAGLELSPFGGAAFLLTAVPGPLAQADLEAVVLETIEALAPLKSEAQPQAVVEQALTLMACHGAIKAGQPLEREEIQALLRQLDESPVSSHCPHGRPLWRLIPYSEIRQGFRRPRG